MLVTSMVTTNCNNSEVIDKLGDPLVANNYAKHQEEYQTNAEDVLILGNQAGLPPIEVEKSIDFQYRFSDLIKEINDNYPGIVSATLDGAIPVTRAGKSTIASPLK